MGIKFMYYVWPHYIRRYEPIAFLLHPDYVQFSYVNDFIIPYVKLFYVVDELLRITSKINVVSG